MLDLTSDRYFDYYLRSANVRSPAANAEDKFTSRTGKGQRLPTDFDTVFARDMDLFEYAVTTDAEYQSGAPPNWVEADRTESYVLWKRRGPTPFVGVLAEEARPGRIFRCSNVEKYGRLLAAHRRRHHLAAAGDRQAARTGSATTGSRSDETTILEPGQSASQTITLPPGEWDLSFQYSSPVAPLRVEADGLEAEMPPGVEGAIPYRVDQGPYWPVGSIDSDGGPVEITVTADELSTGCSGCSASTPRRESATSSRPGCRTGAARTSRPPASSTWTTTTSAGRARSRSPRSRAGERRRSIPSGRA